MQHARTHRAARQVSVTVGAHCVLAVQQQGLPNACQ